MEDRLDSATIGDEANAPRHELEQDLLLAVSHAVSSTLDLGAVLQVIADGTARLAGVETAAVYLIEEQRLFLGATTPPLAPNLPESLLWAFLDDHPHIVEAIRSRSPLVLLDAPRAELTPAEREVVELRNLRSLLYVPFFLDKDPVGVLILGTTTDAHVFEPRESNMCRTLANQLAVGVQNAKLHTGLKRYAAELERQMAEQKRLEEQLRHAQKMEAIGQLAGGIAHDFNNLLQVIQGFASFAREEVPPEGTAHESLGFVLQATERAAVLVRHLLAFGRRETPNLAIVDLRQVVEGLLPMLRPLLGESVTVDCRHGAQLDLVDADPNQLEQVLVNLSVNARDAMPDGGTVVIETRNESIDERRREELCLPRAGEYVLLVVEDTGCGMTPDTQARVFEPFFTTKGPGHGTGLGLAIVHGLVAQHRGAVRIQSAIGCGTRVQVYLPAAEANTRAVSQAEPRAVVGGTETILVVEDELLVLELTRAMLTAAGYAVLTARNGREAFEIIESRASELDLAVLDVVMPELSGGSVLQRLRERRPNIPVVFASGYARAPSPCAAQQGQIAFLAKPFTREKLLRKVREMLDAAR